MKRILLITLLLTGLLLKGVRQAYSQETLTQEIRNVFDKYVRGEGVHNAFFRMESADGTLKLDWVSGQFDSGEKLTKNTPFYTASIGKTFTAAAIAILSDKGALSFEDKVADHLGSMVAGLHMLDGQDYSGQMTIHHLLSHTSGLPDYFEDQPVSGANMMQQLFVNPSRFWQPEELIEYTRANFRSHFPPGKGYHYTDTEYVLLGMIIEKVSGMELHAYFQKHIFTPLSLELTSMNLRSEPMVTPDFPMAELYAGPMKISGYRSLSADWAGGAVRSTGNNLNAFLKALLGGALIKKETLLQMQQWTPESRGTWYGYGLRKWALRELSPDLPDLTLIGHSGSTGAFMYFCPELEVYVSGTFNQTEMMRKHIVFLAETLTIINNRNK